MATQQDVKDIAPGDLVNVRGYGGLAEVLSIYQSDQTGPNSSILYRVTIKWGPHNKTPGKAKYSPVEDFPLGRIEPNETATQQQRSNAIEDMDEAQIRARLAQLNAQLSNA
jgi:hypothetical protein